MAETISYAPTEELNLIRSTAREYLEDRYPLSRVRELMMSEDGFERSAWAEFADLGWTGLMVPEEYGGAGYGFTELSVVLEEMGRLVTPGPFLASAVLATMTILESGTASQREELLPAMVSGEMITTLAMYETGRDWAMDRIATTARPEGDGWVVGGQKRFVLDAHLADRLLVVASTDEGPGLFVVDTTAEGVSVTQTPVLDPTRRQADVAFNDVPAVRLGDGPIEIRRTTGIATAALASEQAGGAQKVLEMAVSYARTRHQFGRPIGSYQAVKHRCAEMLMKVEHAKSTAYHVARVIDDPAEFAIAAPLAGSICSDAYLWAAGENIQIHGGIGFTWEHDAHLYLKRAKASSLLFGDVRHHRGRLAATLGLAGS